MGIIIKTSAGLTIKRSRLMPKGPKGRGARDLEK